MVSSSFELTGTILSFKAVLEFTGCRLHDVSHKTITLIQLHWQWHLN
jgi:hypothetical protein